MEWRHGGSPRPKKIPIAKIRWKSSRLDFWVSRRHPPHWLSSKRPNYQRGVLLVSAGVIEGHSEGKRRGKVTKVVLFLHNNAPAHWALATQKKLAYLGFLYLDHPPYSPDLAPPRRPGWTEEFLNFFLSVLQKLEQRSKKCIELSWGVCWINPEFVRCSLFPS
jgi:hypothetical protein